MGKIPQSFNFELSDADATAAARTIADAIREQHARKVARILCKVFEEARRVYPGETFETIFQRDGSESNYNVTRNGSEVIGCLTVSLIHNKITYSLRCKNTFHITAEDLK